MPTLSLQTDYVDAYLGGKNLPLPLISLEEAHTSLLNKTCKGNEYLGWIDLPVETTDEYLTTLEMHAEEIANMTDVLIVCGIGGSYLGARAILEAFADPYSTAADGPKIVFLGNHLSGREYDRVFHQCKNKRVSACIISKSGTTMETAISYRLVRKFLLEKYSEEEVKTRIVTVTDEKHGALRAETHKEGYVSYVLPGDIGGRYSVLTPVGLFPLAVAGIDIRGLIEGAKKAREEILSNKAPLSRGELKGGFVSESETPRSFILRSNSFGSLSTTENGSTTPLDRGATGVHPTFTYAEKRVALEQSGFVSELFITSEPSLYFLGEWWKQLMGESHGKEGTGLYPDTLSYTTDLHSLGQYVQEGRRLFFETMLWIKSPYAQVSIPEMSGLEDGLDPLVDRSLHDLNLIALESTAKAHNDGGCPSMIMTLENLYPESMGYFLYTMMYACALSGIMIGVNPFNQPGVEAYKGEMRNRLAK